MSIRRMIFHIFYGQNMFYDGERMKIYSHMSFAYYSERQK